MKKPSGRLGLVLWLAALAYLGFYVFGLVMGVYSPGQVPYLTIPAGLMVLALVAVGLRTRHDPGDHDLLEDEALHESRRMREQRGF